MSTYIARYQQQKTPSVLDSLVVCKQ